MPPLPSSLIYRVAQKNWHNKIGTIFKLNVEKSVEVIVHRPQKRNFVCPKPTINIARKSHITVLGVVISNDLKFDKHIDNILQKTSKTLFALKVLRAHGMSDFNLWNVTKAVLIPHYICNICMVGVCWCCPQKSVTVNCEKG